MSLPCGRREAKIGIHDFSLDTVAHVRPSPMYKEGGTYVERVYLSVEFVYANSFCCSPPAVAVLPHNLGILEVKLSCA